MCYACDVRTSGKMVIHENMIVNYVIKNTREACGFIIIIFFYDEGERYDVSERINAGAQAIRFG